MFCLYSKRPPAQVIGENKNLPGPQMIAPYLLASGLMETVSPLAAGVHSYCGVFTAFSVIAKHTFVVGLHLALSCTWPRRTELAPTCALMASTTAARAHFIAATTSKKSGGRRRVVAERLLFAF